MKIISWVIRNWQLAANNNDTRNCTEHTYRYITINHHQLLLLCSEEHILVCILYKMMIVHTLRHISWRLILILAFIVCLGFCIGHLGFYCLCYEKEKLCRHTVPCTVHRRLVHSYIAGVTGWQLWHRIGS